MKYFDRVNFGRCISVALATFFFSTHLYAAKTLVYCSESSPSHFNPQLTDDGASFNANSSIIHNQLVEIPPGETELVSGLATSWKVSKDGLKYTFKLRKNVKFQATTYFKPTRNFNADDVLFTFNRQRLKSHPYHMVGGGIYEYFDSMAMGELIKDIVKVDDYTVQFVLSRPEAPFLANLAMDFASILSAEYGEMLLKAKTPEKLDMFPVGTGPFVFKRYVKDSTIRYEAHPNYFRGKSPLDRLVFVITPDANVRTQKLKTGECHIITEPAPADLPAIEKHPQLQVIQKTGLNVGYLAMNVERPPFDKVLVRRAVNHALNRKAYIDAVFLGHATVAKNPMPPGIWGFHDAIKDYDYKPKKAKALLKEAGFPNGFATELWALPVSRPYNPNGKKMAEMMQADLAKVGIKTKIVTYDWPTYIAKLKAGEHTMLQIGWSADSMDPESFLGLLLSCAAIPAGMNTARWCHQPYDRLVRKAKLVTDKKKRTEYYLKAQEIFHQEAPWVALAHSVIFRAMSKKVVGFKVDQLGRDLFYGVDLH